MTDANSSVLLSSGYRMPLVGLGTWQADDPEILEKSLEEALDAGYRLIDTAFAYKNETFIGNVLKKQFQSGKIKREDVFITTKLPINGLRPENVEYFFRKSLHALQLDYIDLYLIHAPIATQRAEKDEDFLPRKDGDILVDHVDLVETWKELESLVDKGLVRSIGVSNFNSKQIKRIHDAARIKPSNLQVECHAYLPQYELMEFCKNLNISFTAYSPLGSPGFPAFMKKTMNVDYNPKKLFEDERLVPIAKKYNKTLAQILLRYLVQRGISVIPKSTNPQRLKENIQVFDFNLDEEDLDALKSMGSGLRYFNFDFSKSFIEHPEFPFNIPF